MKRRSQFNMSHVPDCKSIYATITQQSNQNDNVSISSSNSEPNNKDQDSIDNYDIQIKTPEPDLLHCYSVKESNPKIEITVEQDLPKNSEIEANLQKSLIASPIVMETKTPYIRVLQKDFNSSNKEIPSTADTSFQKPLRSKLFYNSKNEA